MSPDHYFVVAEPRSRWRRTIVQFLLVGGDASERLTVFTNIWQALERTHVVRTFPDQGWERTVTSVWPGRRVREILLPIRNFFPPTHHYQGAPHAEQGSDRHAGERRVAQAARAEGQGALVRWARGARA